jgi:hypothetical protein
MIEIGIISIIVLAVSYWVTLWLMGRHDDVLHGDFVHGEPATETTTPWDQPFPARPPFPAKPTPKPTVVRTATVKPTSAKPATAKPVSARPVSTQAPPAGPLPPSSPVPVSERLDTLQSLLASIKRDLKDASQL